MTTLLDMSDPAKLDAEQLEAELATLAAHLYAGTCRWLELVAEVDRRGLWAEQGALSSAHWLAWRCALTPRAAREHVRVARCLARLPRIHDVFARGGLSFAKVRALTRVATPETEEELIELAEVHTASQLERTLRCYRRVSTAEAREQQEQAGIGVFWNLDGSLEIHGRLAPEDGAVLLRALEAQRDRLFRTGGSAEPRQARQASNAEALVAVADASLAHHGELRRGDERYQVVLHTEEAVLAEGAEGSCHLEDGTALAPETARRLACDASTVRNGRRSRAVSPPLRRALKARDGGCRFPGCENRRFVDAHHVRHWANGGETTLGNMILLCRRHHRAVHEGGYRVDRDGRFYYPWGGEIAAVPSLPRGDPAALVAAGRDATTCKHGNGERLDLSSSVDAVMEIQRRSARRTNAARCYSISSRG
jgi:hypothetical protein